MTSIHCAPLLAAILLLIPAALAQSPAVGQSLLDQPLVGDVVLPALGGQLTNGVDMAFAIPGDKAPRTVNTGPVTVGFTTANAVQINGQVTLTLPKGYLNDVDSSKVNTFTGTSSTCKCVGSAGATNYFMTCTVQGAALAAGAVTLSLSAGAITTGAPTAAGTYNVQTTTDRALSVPAATQQIGGVITNLVDINFKTTTDASIPGSANAGIVEVGFSVATTIPIGGTLTLSLPKNYFAAVSSTAANTFAGKSTATNCAVTKASGTVTEDSVVCTIAVAALDTGAQVLSFVIGSVTTGAPQADGVFKVASSTDRESTISKKAPKLGGTVSNLADMAFDSATKAVDTVPGTLNTGLIDIIFQTATDLPVGGKITIALPSKYFSKVDESKTHFFKTAKTVKSTCVLVPGVVGVKVLDLADADSVICTLGVALPAMKAADNLQLAIGSVTTGIPQAAADFNVATSSDIAGSAKKTVVLGDTLTDGVDLAFTQDNDRIPGRVASNNNTITFEFKSVSGVPVGGKITVVLPKGYVSKVDSTKDNTVGTTATARCALANTQSSVQTSIETSKTSVSTDATLTVRFIPDVVFGVNQLTIPLAGFSLNADFTAECNANCGGNKKVTVSLTNSVLTVTWPPETSITHINTLTTIAITSVKTPATLGWAVSGISGTLTNPSATVVCTTAGAAIAAKAAVKFTFVSGAVTIGTAQKALTFDVSTSTDLPLATRPATVSLGGGLTGGKALAFANPQDQIPGRVNSGSISLGATLANSVPIGGQFLLTFPSNYFTNVNPNSVVALTKGTRRSLLQTSTLSCVRTAGTPVDQITCTLAGAASGTGAVVITFPAGSLTTGLPAVGGGFNLATANPPVAGAARVPYFPKAAGSAYGVAGLLVVLSAFLACF